MVKVVVTYILDSKIINNESKHDGAPFVAPKPWSSGGFVSRGELASGEWVNLCLAP